MASAILKGARFAGTSLLRFRGVMFFCFIFLFIIIIVINATVISIQERSLTPAVKEIGGRLFFTTHSLSENSKLVIEQEGVYDGSNGFLKGVWGVIKIYARFYIDIYSIYLWVQFLTFIVVHIFPLSGDSSRKFTNMILSLSIFFALQIIFLLVFQPLDISKMDALSMPFLAFKDFLFAIPYLISPVSGLVAQVTRGDELQNLTVGNVSQINQTLLENVTHYV